MNLPACLRCTTLFAATSSMAVLTGCFMPPPPPPGHRPYPIPQPDYQPYHQGQDDFVGPPPPPRRTPPTTPASDYPTATRTNNPDQVISPFKPYNVIDITGFNSGQLAKDPSNNRIFRVP